MLRIPANTLDDTVSNLLMNLFSNADRRLDLLRPYSLPPHKLDAAIQAGAQLAKDWHERPISEQIPILNRCVTKVILSRNEVRVTIAEESLVRLIIGEDESSSSSMVANPSSGLTLTQPVSLRRSGIESKLIYPAQPTPTVHHRSVKALQQALLNSLQWNEDLVTRNVRSVDELIERDQLNARQMHNLRKLAFLAPDIMERIIAGDVPETLTLERLKKGFPLDWRAQSEHFGLKSSAV